MIFKRLQARLIINFIIIFIGLIIFNICCLFILLLVDSTNNILDCINQWFIESLKFQMLLESNDIFLGSTQLYPLLGGVVNSYASLFPYAPIRFMIRTIFDSRRLIFNFVFQRKLFTNLPLGEFLANTFFLTSTQEELIFLFNCLLSQGNYLFVSIANINNPNSLNNSVFFCFDFIG